MAPWGNYWGYYEPARPREVKDGIKAKSQRGDIGETWWSKRWIGVLESFNMGERLSRGRSYARKGQAASIDVQKGEVSAKVQGTRPKPYSVKIRLKVLSDDEWDKVTDTMACQAIFAAKLLCGEMPQNIEDAFKEAEVSLFPTSKRELDTGCSCPDWANPCKHIACVYYLLAERFDEDPFLIFQLRGRTKEEIIHTLREKRAMIKSPESLTISEADQASPSVDNDVRPLEECLDNFWQSGEDLDCFAVNPAAPEVDNAIIRRLGEPPFATGKVDLVSWLMRAYDIASTAALERAIL